VIRIHFLAVLALGAAAVLPGVWLVPTLIDSAHAETAPAAQARPAFDIWEYQVTGNSKLDVESIERAVYPFLGEAKTITDVEAARGALEKAYRDAGYATTLVSIPEQMVASGVVQLAVTEGRVERVRVTGAKYYDQGRILEQVPALTEGGVPDFNDLQRQLAGVNTGDLRVQPMLRPGQVPGTADVDLKVDDDLPLHGGIDFNNRYSPSHAPNPGYYRATGSLRYDNLWQREHSISMSYLTSPGHPDEVKVGSLSYSLPAPVLGGAGTTLTGYAVHSDSNDDLTTSLAGTNVLGKGDIAGLRLAQPLPAAGAINHSLTWGLDYKHLRQDLRQQDAAFETPLTYDLATVQYAGARADDAGETAFGATLALSVRGIRANEDQFANNRFQGQGNFAMLRWYMQRLQLLPGKFTLTGRLEGQSSSLPLPPSEEYAIGGADSVRGYPESTQIGDNGARGLLELRTPSLSEHLGPARSWGDLRLLTFVEGAQVRVLSPLPGQQARYTLASYGLGLRLASRRGVQVVLDYGWRLRDGQTTDTHGSVAEGGGRLHFDMAYQF
jgi:hemolysin activation/secretion protein